MGRGALWFGGTPGLCRGGFGEEVHPGDGAGSDGDLRCTGEAAADPKTGGDLMEAAAAGPASMPASCDGVWGDLRFPEGEPSMGDCTWRIVGDFRGLSPGECTWLPATEMSRGFRPRPRGPGGAEPRLGALLGALRGRGGMWLSRLLVLWSDPTGSLRLRKPPPGP